jgi:hypothetical protein
MRTGPAVIPFASIVGCLDARLGVLPLLRPVAALPKGANPVVMRGSVDGASRTRTGDLLGAIQALSQLSYSPEVDPW